MHLPRSSKKRKRPTSYNVDRGFISKLLSTKDMTTVRDSRITPKFLSGEHKVAYQYILDVAVSSGEVPTIRAFSKKFPQYQLEMHEGDVGTEEPLKFWIDELREKTRQNTLAEKVEESASLLNDLDSESALKVLKQTISFIESEVEETKDVDLTKDTDLRKQSYKERKLKKGMMGISYGIPFLDMMTKGLKEETLTTIIANTGVGKTFFMVMLGAYAALNGITVYQGVTEMSESQMRDRYEAILFAMMYGEMDYNKFKSGMLPRDIEKKYYEFLENDLPELPPIIMSVVSSPMQVEADIDKYNPGLILIDGAYLMDDDQGADSDWLRITHITRDLKKIMKRRKKPGVINTQSDKNTSKKTGAELGDISYSQSIGQDSDDVLALFNTPLMKADKEMFVKVLKCREGVCGRVLMNWDFTKMNFHQIYGEEENASSEDDQKQQEEDGYSDDNEEKNLIRKKGKK